MQHYLCVSIRLKYSGKDFPFSSAITYFEQELLSGDTAIIAETGDSWFNCQKLRLPENCG